MKVWVLICFDNIAGVASTSPSGARQAVSARQRGRWLKFFVAALNVPLSGAYQVVTVRCAVPRGGGQNKWRVTCVDRSRRC